MFKKLDLKRLQPKFIAIVTHHMERNNIDQKTLARKLELNEGVLSNLLNRKRPLTANYLMPFFFRGIIMPEEIMDGQANSDREKEFWDAARLCHRFGMLRKIVALEGKGVNVEAVLDGLLLSQRETK